MLLGFESQFSVKREKFQAKLGISRRAKEISCKFAKIHRDPELDNDSIVTVDSNAGLELDQTNCTERLPGQDVGSGDRRY
jgi:hypothetical protein